MNKLYRSMLLSGILAAGLAGCGDDVTVVDPPAPVPPTPQVRSVTVAPDNVQVSPGQTIQMSAAVTADSGATPTVTWSTSDATRATVNGTGLVTIV
ncbi:MAG: Ig-like domain-containing protein, partial [Gemmatimonadetes bacterium]|nr:Ig-like domain-containing protein [Gemmatimonadota bacterium]